MALKAGTAYVDVAAKVAPGFQGDVDKAITPGMDATGKKAGGILSSSFGKAAAVAGAGVLAAKGTEFLKGAVDAARESAKIAAQSEAVVKSTGGAANISAGQMGDLATAISKKTAVDDEAIQSAENLLATFTNVKNGVGEGNDVFNQATATLVDMGAALGGDASSSAIQLGKALNDPIKGITALTRVGVTFTQAQKDQIAAMVEAGDTAGAQKIILSELNKEFGGSAAAQATASDRLGVAWGNVEEEIGGKLIPILDKVSNFLADHTALIGPLIGVIAGGLVIAFTAWAISAASAAVATIAAAAPVLAIIAVVALLVAGIYLLVKNWDAVWTKIKEIASAALDAVKGALSAAWDWIKETTASVWNAIKDFFVQWWPILLAVATGGLSLLVGFVIQHWDAIKNAISSALEAVKGAISGALSAIASAWSAAWNGVKSFLSGVWDGIKRVVSSAIDGLVDVFVKLPLRILGALHDLEWKMLDFGKRIIQKIIDGIKSVAGGIAKAVGSAVTGGLSKLPVVGGLFKAAGGPVSGSTPYVVGEAGPEVFVPRVSGGIVPTSTILDALGSSPGGGGGGPFAGAMIAVDARGRDDDPWFVGSTLNRSLRELSYAEGWS